jgi:hypothetical protein
VTLFTVFITYAIPSAKSQSQQLWALIISGSADGSFSNNTRYMYHVLDNHYSFDGIRYLDVDTSRTGVDALSTLTNVRSAITSWLAGNSDSDDTIFIYFSSHGGGYQTLWDHRLPYAIEGGRYDSVSGDEGDEVQESSFREWCWVLNALYDLMNNGPPFDRVRNFDTDAFIEVDIDDDGTIDGQFDALADLDGDGWSDDILIDPDRDDFCDVAIDADTNHDDIIDNFISDGEDTNADQWIVGIDLNGNGNTNDWVGIDECMSVQDGVYWDDDLASDLNQLSYAKLIFVRQGCVEEDQGCFGGGIIDDISGSKRIIMTASNETCYSYGDMDDDGYSEWSEAFIDALHGEKTHYNPTTDQVVHESPPQYVDADWSNDGHVSMWEAWDYAWKNDDAGPKGANLETPWLDDNFNSLPTYEDEQDYGDTTDGLFSMETYFGFSNLKTADIDDDGDVQMDDIAFVSQRFDTEPGDPNWDARADLNNDDKVDMRDVSFAARHFGKIYSDPPSPVSTNTILFTYPFLNRVIEDESFSVNVTLFNASRLVGWEFRLYWNNFVLECTDLQIHVPEVWGENGIELGPGVENDFNITHGRCYVALTSLYPAPSFNGSMIVVTLTFQAKTVGITKLDLQNTQLVDSAIVEIPHISIDSLVIVRNQQGT